MQTLKITLTLATALLATSTTAYADTLKVPADFGTIQAAVDVAQPGDKIVIGPGVYDELVVLDGKTDLVIIGKNGAIIGQAPAGGGDLDDEKGISLVGCENILLKKLAVLGSYGFAGISMEACEGVKIQRCVVRNGNGHGIEVRGCTNVVIQKNLVENMALNGISIGDPLNPSLDTDGALVKSNVVNNSGLANISLFGSDNTIIKNKIDGGLKGIVANGDANDILGNTIEETLEDGILLSTGIGHLVTKNKVLRVSGDGIDIEADACIVSKNKVDQAGDDGISIDATFGSLIERNKITNTLDDGVRLNATGNTLIKNIATGSAQLDLRSLVGAEGNTFSGNVFPSNNIGL